MTVYRYAALAFIAILCGLAAWYVLKAVILAMVLEAL